MTLSLTTGWCAQFLNERVEMDAYSAAYILSEIRMGRLDAQVIKGNRRRSHVRVHPRDFRAYLSAYYPTYLPAFDELFHLELPAKRIAS